VQTGGKGKLRVKSINLSTKKLSRFITVWATLVDLACTVGAIGVFDAICARHAKGGKKIHFLLSHLAYLGCCAIKCNECSNYAC